MRFKVYSLPVFDLDVEKYFNKVEKDRLNKLVLDLGKNGDLIGKPLSYNFLREKKIKEKRIYFLVYNEICIILLVAISDKKSQQKIINEIKELLFEYRDYVYKYLK